MHMIFDDETCQFSSTLIDLKNGRAVGVYIPSNAPSADFAGCYDQLRRLNEAADYLFELIGSGLEDMEAAPALEAVSLLSNTLIESRYEFGQRRDQMSDEQIREFEHWMESFADMVSDLKAMSPANVIKQMYCHHLVVGDSVQCHYRFEGFEGDVMVTEMPMAFMHGVTDRLVILPAGVRQPGMSLH